MEKGLFSSLFVLIMLILVAPSLSLMDKSQDFLDTSSEINNIIIASDLVIADALSDVSFANGCLIDTESNYNTEVNTYLNNLIVEVNNLSSIECSYDNFTGNLAGDDYTGSLQITCFSENEYSTVSITKELKFKKEIDLTINVDCEVKIKDNYNADNLQVDLVR